jgi:hydrogenase/urease accessory protein HupE
MRKSLFPLIILLAVLGAHAHGISEADQQAMLEGGNLRYLWLGAVHMVTGYDHLLFLFGVIFYLTGFKDILKFVTAFTLGHSITLILATFLGISANYYLVDAVIALSVCYKAFDNLDGFRKYLKVNAPPLLPMILLFGLIHGFGLSTRLQQLPLPEEGLLARILSFNVGVELGQVAALTVIVALLAGWRRTASFKKMGGVANFILLLAGVGLFAYQVTMYLSGGGRPHDDHHEESQEAEHSHGAGSHSHGKGEQNHGTEEHSHDEAEAPTSPSGNSPDSAAYVPPGSTSEEVHSHEEDAHSHEGHGHSHDHEEGPKPKRPPAKVPSTHSHEGAAPHSH